MKRISVKIDIGTKVILDELQRKTKSDKDRIICDCIQSSSNKILDEILEEKQTKTIKVDIDEKTEMILEQQVQETGQTKDEVIRECIAKMARKFLF